MGKTSSENFRLPKPCFCDCSFLKNFQCWLTSSSSLLFWFCPGFRLRRLVLSFFLCKWASAWAPFHIQLRQCSQRAWYEKSLSTLLAPLQSNIKSNIKRGTREASIFATMFNMYPKGNLVSPFIALPGKLLGKYRFVETNTARMCWTNRQFRTLHLRMKGCLQRCLPCKDAKWGSKTRSQNKLFWRDTWAYPHSTWK